jgi:ribonucleoside-diphosphate reductase alpha chain
VDYVFRALGVEYLERDELAQVPPDRELPEPPKGLAVEAGIQLDLTDAAAEADVDALKAAAAFVDAPSSNGAVAVQVTEKIHVEEKVTVVAGSAAMVDSALKESMGDAPVCSNCGHMTIRNGSCYVCLTCGDTTGCS